MDSVIALGLTITIFAAWVNHIIITVQAEAWTLMLAGAFMPPIGVIHGVCSWLGYSWV